MNIFQSLGISLFGVIIAFFHTTVLSGMYNKTLKPTWLLYVLYPLLIFVGFIINTNSGQFVAVLLFCSTFVIAIFGFIYTSIFDDTWDKLSKTKKVKQKDIKKHSIIESNLLGTSDYFKKILYYIFLIILILATLFLPQNNINSDLIIQQLYLDFQIQLTLTFFFMVLSFLIFCYFKLKNNSESIINALTLNKSSKNTSLVLQNYTKITSLFLIISVPILCYYCFKSYALNDFVTSDAISIKGINLSFLVFFIYNIYLSIFKTRETLIQNGVRFFALFRASFSSIFLFAACVPFIIFMEKELKSLNLSIEAMPLLALNTVLLITEILLFKKNSNKSAITVQQNNISRT